MLEFLNLLSPEERFKEAFPKEAFEAASLPDDVTPLMVTPLPYEKGKIKERFKNYKKLAELWLTRSLLYRYEGKRPINDKTIVLFTWVMSDGFGDLAAQMEAANVIKEAFPELDVELVSLVEVNRKYNPVHKDCKIHLIPYEGHDRVLISKEVMTLMREASLILQISTLYPYWHEIEQAIIKDSPTSPEMVTIGGYGFIDSDSFHPESGNLCMGVHSLEQGLLFPKSVTAKQENFYFAYLRSSRGFAIYLHALLDSEKTKSDDIHVIYLDALPLLQALEQESWEGYDIKEIVIFDEGQRHLMMIGNKGKKVTFERQSGLSPAEVMTLMVQSKPFVGCRGDRSFSELVTANKLFYYDAPSHAKPFLKDLLIIVQKELAGYPSLESYIELMLDTKASAKEIGEKISSALSDASLVRGMEKLHELLLTSCSFNRSMLNLVVQKTHHHFYPLQKEADCHLLELLIGEKIPLQEIFKNDGA